MQTDPLWLVSVLGPLGLFYYHRFSFCLLVYLNTCFAVLIPLFFLFTIVNLVFFTCFSLWIKIFLTYQKKKNLMYSIIVEALYQFFLQMLYSKSRKHFFHSLLEKQTTKRTCVWRLHLDKSNIDPTTFIAPLGNKPNRTWKKLRKKKGTAKKIENPKVDILGMVWYLIKLLYIIVHHEHMIMCHKYMPIYNFSRNHVTVS